MNEVKMTFSEQEANVLLQLIDIAIKAQGLQVAEAGSFLATKIREEAQAQLPKPESEEAEGSEAEADSE